MTPVEHSQLPDASDDARSTGVLLSRKNHITNALGHVALLYFDGEAKDKENICANVLGHVTLLCFIGEAIDSRNHVAKPNHRQQEIDNNRQ